MAIVKRIAIVGGVAGGASAATRARRLSEDAQITLFERGESISFANCGMPYHIGGVIGERGKLLVQTPAAMQQRYRIQVRTRTEVLAIDRAARVLTVRDRATGQESREPYDELILSPGAEPVRPPIPGADSARVLTLRSLADMDAIKRIVDVEKPASAVIVGGGYIGLEMAEALRTRGVGVTMVELASQVFGAIDPEMASPVHQVLRLHGVDLRLGVSVTAIETQGSELVARLSSGESVWCGLLLLAIGVRPEVKLARDAGLEIGPSGGIVVDPHMRTSDPHIFAVGDAVEVTDFVGGYKTVIPLAGPANRQGRIAADNAMGRPSVYKHTQGTAICKVFDLAVGMTGLSEKTLQRRGRAFEKVYVHPAAHANYYPGAGPLTLKLLFDPADGKVLGAQAVGTQGVDKRIDVLAVAIRAGMTVYDLGDLELSYAPPYGSAKDPINYAGFAAANVLRGDVRICHAADMLAPTDKQMLLDVRTPGEVQAGTIPGAVNVPVDELRDRLGELPRDKELLVFCQVGLRGYLACRTLTQNGFACRNLSGGYKTYLAVVEAMPKPPPAAPPPPGETTDDGRAVKDAPSGNGCGCCGGSEPAKPQAVRPFDGKVARQIDATAMQCPGPVLRLQAEMATLKAGEALAISVRDPGFVADAEGWCKSTGNTLIEMKAADGAYVATIRKDAQPATAAGAACASGGDMARHKTIIVFSNALDRVMASMIIANGAAAMGSKVTMFFTFWGLNVLRRPAGAAVTKTFIERMFGWMMPRGAGRLTLSQMHMAGMGTAMMKGIMRKKNVTMLPGLIESARKAGVRLIACTMTMDLMGIKREELIDGVEFGGVASYLAEAEQGNVNLFI